MQNVPLLIATIVGTVVLVVVIAFYFADDPSFQGPEAVDPTAIMGEVRHNVKGDLETASVVVVEFSDFQCPACRATRPLVESLFEQYGDDVALVYRHFPLDSIHANARWAAAAAEVAGEAGLFWEMHDVLFDNQTEWSAISGRGDLLEFFADLASELEIDKTDFLERIEGDDIHAVVQTDSLAGLTAGVSATPTFYVNGQPTSAPQLLATVETVLASAD